MSTITITIIVVVFVVLAILVKLIAKGEKITEYFKNAVTVYLWLEDPSAGTAALTSAKSAAAGQRDAMVSHLMQFSSKLTLLIDKVPELQILKVRLERLAQEIAAKDWTMRDVRKAKAELGKVSPKYLQALNQSDPSVFVSTYPTLFHASNILELVQAAEQLKRTEIERGVEVLEKLKGIKEFQNPKVKASLDQAMEQAKTDLSS